MNFIGIIVTAQFTPTTPSSPLPPAAPIVPATCVPWKSAAALSNRLASSWKKSQPWMSSM
jgi:hypothetical protein